MAAREDLGSDTASHVQDYACVKLEDGVYGGWKLDILCEEVSQSEKRLVTCSQCKGLLRDAYEVKLMDRQVIRCKSCLSKVPERKAENIREFIDEKMVFCPLDDCKWSDQLKNLIWHLGECPFVKIPCPLKCFSERGEMEEIRRIERRLIGQHQERDCSMRSVTCEFCNKQIRSCEVNMHLENCVYFPVPCPNACDSGEKKLRRKELPAHLGTLCPLQHIPCHYSLYGCEVAVLRKDLEQHEKDECYLHNRLMSNKLELVLRIQENTVKENTELKSTLNKMSKVQENTLKDNAEQKSSLNKMSKVQENTLKENTELKSTLNKMSKVQENTLKDNAEQKSSLNKMSKVQVENCSLIKQLESNNIELRQELNSPTLSLSVPHKGVLDWTLTKVPQKIHNAGISHSEPFYAGFYRFMMDIDWNSEKGHIGIFTRLIRGEWDDQLLWPVRYRCRCSILHNGEDLYSNEYEISHHDVNQHPKTFSNPSCTTDSKGMGLSKYAPHSTIKTLFDIDNSISFQVAVEILEDSEDLSRVIQSDIPLLRNSIIQLNKKVYD